MILHYASPLDTPLVSGLFLDALGYSTRKHKVKVKVGQVNDTSALLLVPNDSEGLNLYIDKRDPVVMPPVHYHFRCSAYGTGYILYVLTIQKKIS